MPKKNNSQEYWAKRRQQDKIKVINTGENGINNLKKLLKNNLDDVEKQITKYFEKYADKKENLSPKELLAYKKKLKDAVKKVPNDKILKKLLVEDAPKYKIDRLRALQTDLQLTLTEATIAQEKGIASTLDDVAKVSQSVLAKSMQASIGLKFNTIASRKLKQILSSDWSGATWSDRLWKDRELVGKKLTDILERGMVQGTSLQKMSRELKQVTGQSFNNAFRLIRTETSHIDGQVTLEGYKQAGEELGLEYYEYDAFLDSRTSDICRELDKKRFKVSEAEVGVNYPPMHPNCRSTTQLVLDEEYKPEPTPQPTKNPQKFIDGVINNNLNPPQNEVIVGKIKPNIRKFLKEQGVELKQKNINLTYKRVEHSLRDTKNPLQKVSVEQLKNIGSIIAKNNAYYDTKKKNIIFVGILNNSEMHNAIKVPVNIRKVNEVATVSKIPLISITNDSRYKKID